MESPCEFLETKMYYARYHDYKIHVSEESIYYKLMSCPWCSLENQLWECALYLLGLRGPSERKCFWIYEASEKMPDFNNMVETILHIYV